jgi:LacI family xylobiose transport system transcriptional regulator
VDNAAVVELAMRHLVELGHRRIAHLSGPSNALTAQARVEGYRCWAVELGLDYAYCSANAGAWSAEEGYRAALALLDAGERPTALFASNDRLAIGAAHALRERGLRIPEDVSLVGVDDIEASRYLNPPLTTIRQPLDAMARAGIDLLLRLMNGGQDQATEQITLAPTLVVRASTAAPGR